jgi:hypothetical protein
MVTKIKSVLLAMMVATPIAAQTTSPTGGTTPSANPADVASTDAIVGALYASISGPAGQDRDWDRFRSLFIPEAKLIPSFVRQGSTKAEALVWSVEEYIDGPGQSLKESGFFEREIKGIEERFESIAHRFSTYDSKRTLDGDIIAKGINSIQLLWDGERWWIVNVFWRGGGPNIEIPGKYRGDGGDGGDRGDRLLATGAPHQPVGCLACFLSHLFEGCLVVGLQVPEFLGD